MLISKLIPHIALMIVLSTTAAHADITSTEHNSSINVLATTASAATVNPLERDAHTLRNLYAECASVAAQHAAKSVLKRNPQEALVGVIEAMGLYGDCQVFLPREVWEQKRQEILDEVVNTL
jgi:hypothetical protein